VLQNEIKRYTYGSGSGTSSVGMVTYNFVTRSMPTCMEKLSSDIHTFLTRNKKHLNLETVDMNHKFNHCSVILYYAGSGFNISSKLGGFHSDCVYSTHNGTFVSINNSQVINTPSKIYPLSDSRVLNWRRRTLSNDTNVRNHWIGDDTFREHFKLDQDTITIVNP